MRLQDEPRLQQMGQQQLQPPQHQLCSQLQPGEQQELATPYHGCSAMRAIPRYP
jgi:hypothetical protein